LHKQRARLRTHKAPLPPEAYLAPSAASAPIAPAAALAINQFNPGIPIPSESMQLNRAEQLAGKQNDVELLNSNPLISVSLIKGLV
jgi:hypothetical protein